MCLQRDVQIDVLTWCSQVSTIAPYKKIGDNLVQDPHWLEETNVGLVWC